MAGLRRSTGRFLAAAVALQQKSKIVTSKTKIIIKIIKSKHILDLLLL